MFRSHPDDLYSKVWGVHIYSPGCWHITRLCGVFSSRRSLWPHLSQSGPLQRLPGPQQTAQPSGYSGEGTASSSVCAVFTLPAPLHTEWFGWKSDWQASAKESLVFPPTRICPCRDHNYIYLAAITCPLLHSCVPVGPDPVQWICIANACIINRDLETTAFQSIMSPAIILQKKVEDTVEKLEAELAILLDAIDAPKWRPLLDMSGKPSVDILDGLEDASHT